MGLKLGKKYHHLRTTLLIFQGVKMPLIINHLILALGALIIALMNIFIVGNGGCSTSEIHFFHAQE